ncbi:MAG: DUF4390 domain-containing protein [Desulfobulbaceae bacterium]|nr:DUF4390 domain-containing protein [Desulfobulbaceae bacterium]
MKRLIAVFFLVLFAPALAAARADAPIFDELAVNNSETELFIYASLRYTFSEEMVGGLQSGIPLRFRFHVELNERDSGWVVGAWEFTHRLRYDTLQDKYRFEDSGARNFREFSDLAQAEKAMMALNGAPLVPLSALKPNIVYTLRLRADLYQREFPGGLPGGQTGAVARMVMKLWDVKTDWQDFSFTLR